ncbi:MAG: CRTAC1 family protein [Rhodothermales bacterium]|jgi:enediyne biosynthesis protein E4|nr:CRTAC1 family protein [Rhodothermales bacterium]MDG2015503.1 CRTAC1 family protein [Rhodothermales bacterium]
MSPTEAPALSFAFEEIQLPDSFRHHNGAQGQKWFPETMSGGGAFLDIDSDGDLDVLIPGGATLIEDVSRMEGDVLALLNDGSGTFSEALIPGLDHLPGYAMGLYPADLDQDGDIDLVYTSLGPNLVLENTNGTFVATPLASANDDWSTAALIFDADGDGWLDILIGNYVDWSAEKDIFCSTDGSTKGYCTPELYEGVTASFFRNRGDGSFYEDTNGTGFEAIEGKTLGLAMADVNADGLPDVLVANDTDPDQMLINQGGGSFVDEGIVSGLAFDERGRARAGMGIDSGITDDSDRETVFVGNFSDEMIGVYRQFGPGSFIDRAAGSAIGQPSTLTLTFGLMTSDLNLDGHVDVITANGHVEQTIESIRDNVRYKQTPHLFASDGKGSFDDVAPSISAFGAYAARALAIGDIDGDADPDILLVENNGPAHIWKNQSTGSALKIVLESSIGPAHGIGARIEVWSNQRMQSRLVKSGSSYLSGSETAAFFGLSDASIADSILVHWPSGHIQRRTNVSSGNLLIRETEH